jgi:hypothetical protein
MDEKQKHKFSKLTRLYNEVTRGAAGIFSEEDAVYTAAILQELVKELDPAGKGDPRGKKYMDKLKELIHYDHEHGEF